MKHIIFCGCLLMLAGTASTNASDQIADSAWMKDAVKISTDSGNYLILATFRDTRLVDHFIDRMRPQFDKPVKVSTLQFDERTIYRVMVGPFDKKLTRIQNQYADLGLSGIWWLSVNAGELKHFESDSMVAGVKEVPTRPAKAVAAKPVAAAKPVVVEPAVVAQTVVKPVVASTADADSNRMSLGDRLEFCATKANAREVEKLCSNRKIKAKVAKYLKLLDMPDREYFTYCAKAPGSERPLYCTDRFSEVKANHSTSLQASNHNVQSR
jgi:hypothetical protein